MDEIRSLNMWHVSGDFPDPIEPGKTQAIRRLVDMTAEQFAHRVISINRRMPGAAPIEIPFDYGLAITYPAPPLGLFHVAMLNRLGDRIAAATVQRGKPDLLVAHKLTIEGVAVAHAAQALGVPYAVLVQGNTDCKILSARPDLRRLFQRIYHGAGCAFHLAPWSRHDIERRLGVRKNGSRLLPCPLAEDGLLAPQTGAEGFISAFHLDGYRNKNIAAIAKAMAMLEASTAPVQCKVAGGGGVQARRACEAIAARTPGLELIGEQSQAELGRLLNASTAMVLPSKRESFGLVFIEALMAGAPIIYPRRAAVAGYFDGAGFALPVNPRNPREIANAMMHAIQHEVAMKQELAHWQASAAAERFKRSSIAAEFAAGLQGAAKAES